MTDGPTDEEVRAWGERWEAIGDAYMAEYRRTVSAFETATAHRDDCDVCAAILDMVPRDVPAFLDAFERAGPVSGQHVTVGGVWTFERAAYLWHESQHGT